VVIENSLWLNLATALGIGLLIGAERERSKGSGAQRAFAGLRTFTIASLLGAISTLFSFWLLAISVLCVMIFVAVAYFARRNEDPGLTTEIALVFTVILGGLAMSQTAMAAALAVVIAILLAAKQPLHGFVMKVITKNELHDFLILAAATLIILPLMPNRFIGPFEVINPRNLWLVVILIMLINALGHIALRWFGSRIGLPIAGFFSGFISSIVAIGSMGERTKETPALMDAGLAGAVLSSVATMLQLAILLAAVHPPILKMLGLPLVAGGLVMAIYGAWLAFNAHQNNIEQASYQPKQPFKAKLALMLTLVIGLALIISAALKAWFGEQGLLVASAIAGLADVHSAAISVATLAASHQLSTAGTSLPILVAISVNAIAKVIMAVISGSKKFVAIVITSHTIQIGTVWVVWYWF
jgi:uncharacterized membrane protein (DUF4010 family)